MTRSLVVLGVAAVLASPGLGLAQAPAQPATKSLYERLGGLYNVAAVVDDLIERVYNDATLNANPRINQARKPERKAGLKVHLANQVCMVTGGPCKYTGLDMKAAHKTFTITEKEWQALLGDFKAALDKFKVPAAEQKELVDIVNSTKPEIVAGAAASKK